MTEDRIEFINSGERYYNHKEYDKAKDEVIKNLFEIIKGDNIKKEWIIPVPAIRMSFHNARVVNREGVEIRIVSDSCYGGIRGDIYYIRGE